MPAGPGLADGVLGIARVTVDPAALTAALEPVRTSQAQGDLYHLSIRPFQGPGDVEVTRVRKDAGNVVVTVKFKHPFDAPADLNPPATATKRIDLHIFDVTALVVADGTDTFFTGSDQVLTNGDLLVNADAYRMPGGTFSPLALGVAANTFPYKLVARNIDTVNPAGNYVATAHGWQGPTLLDPFGYDVFPQGAEVEVDFELALGLSPTTFNLVTLAKYMDPRATPQPKLKRLPVPGDPTSLRYILPEAAGDIQKIDVAVQGNLVSGSSSNIATLDVTVLDWDHSSTVAVPFPNDADLSQLSEPSAIGNVTADIPQVRSSGPLGLPAVSGTAPLLTTSSAFTNEAGFTTPPTGTTVKGLVRVTDQQDDSAPVPVTLDESLQPAAAAPSTRYQLFRVFVAGPSTGPTCLEYAPNAPALQATQGVGFRLDIDTAATPASDPDGIAGYRVDYNNDGTWDTGLRQPDGTPAPDFTADPPHIYTATGPQPIKVEVQDAAVPPLTTVCNFTVTVNAAPPGVVLDPMPTPGGINSDMGSATGNVTYGAYPVFAADAAGDSYSAVYRSSAPGNGINVYRSLDGGVTWPGPGNLLPLFANGAYTTQNSSWSLGVLANGLPAIAARDGGSDLTFISAVSESAGTIDWGGSTRGVEIENLGTWDGVVLCPSRTNANRAYIVAINTSNTTGPNFDQICLWLSTNAASPNPTFTLLPTIADSMNGAAGQESGLRAVVDSGDDLHLVWEVPGGGQAMYRKFIDDGSATGGAWAAPEAVIAIQLPYTGGFRDFEIAVNAANEPAICWMDEDPNARPSNNGNTIYLTKFTTGSGWTTAQQVVNTITTRENFVFWPSLFFDNAGRIHLAWRDNREQATTTYEVWGSVWNGTGTMEIIDDFEILLAPSSTMDYINAPRNAYNPVFNKAIVAMQADFVPTDGYWRYRTYSLP